MNSYASSRGSWPIAIFLLNEASFHPQNPLPTHLLNSYSSTAVYPAGLLSAKWISLFRFVISVFTNSSSEIAAERFPFKMFVMALSTKPCRDVKFVLYFVSLESKGIWSFRFVFQLLVVGLKIHMWQAEQLTSLCSALRWRIKQGEICTKAYNFSYNATGV